MGPPPTHKRMPSESWEDPRKGQGRRGDEQDAQRRLCRGAVGQLPFVPKAAANGLVGIGWGPFREARREGLFADLNHHVLLRATCRDKRAGPKVALRGDRFGFHRGSFKRFGHGFCRGIAASRHLADVECFSLAVQPVLEGDDLFDL